MTFRYFILLIVLTAACEAIPDESEFQVNISDRPNQEGWDSEVIVTRDGVTEMILKYHHMLRWDQRQQTSFSGGLTIDLYEKGTHTAVLTSDSGMMRPSANEMVAVGNVVVISDSGVSLRSRKLFWDEPLKKVRAEGFVQITTQEDTLYGYDFESDRDLKNWKIKRAYGQSAKDVDIRTGTVRSRSADDDEKSRQLDEGVKDILKEEP